MDPQKEIIFEFLYEFRIANHMAGSSKKLFFRYLSSYDDKLLLFLFEKRLKEAMENEKHLLDYEYFKNKKEHHNII